MHDLSWIWPIWVVDRDETLHAYCNPNPKEKLLVDRRPYMKSRERDDGNNRPTDARFGLGILQCLVGLF
jgi:hypothetical protein